MGRPPPPERGRLMLQPAVQSVRPAVPTTLPSFCPPQQSGVHLTPLRRAGCTFLPLLFSFLSPFLKRLRRNKEKHAKHEPRVPNPASSRAGEGRQHTRTQPKQVRVAPKRWKRPSCSPCWADWASRSTRRRTTRRVPVPLRAAPGCSPDAAAGAREICMCNPARGRMADGPFRQRRHQHPSPQRRRAGMTSWTRRHVDAKSSSAPSRLRVQAAGAPAGSATIGAVGVPLQVAARRLKRRHRCREGLPQGCPARTRSRTRLLARKRPDQPAKPRRPSALMQSVSPPPLLLLLAPKCRAEHRHRMNVKAATALGHRQRMRNCSSKEHSRRSL